MEGRIDIRIGGGVAVAARYVRTFVCKQEAPARIEVFAELTARAGGGKDRATNRKTAERGARHCKGTLPSQGPSCIYCRAHLIFANLAQCLHRRMNICEGIDRYCMTAIERER